MSSNRLPLLIRFALLLEPISPSFVSFWLRRKLKSWKNKGLIDARALSLIKKTAAQRNQEQIQSPEQSRKYVRRNKSHFRPISEQACAQQRAPVVRVSGVFFLLQRRSTRRQLLLSLRRRRVRAHPEAVHRNLRLSRSREKHQLL